MIGMIWYGTISYRTEMHSVKLRKKPTFSPLLYCPIRTGPEPNKIHRYGIVPVLYSRTISVLGRYGQNGLVCPRSCGSGWFEKSWLGPFMKNRKMTTMIFGFIFTIFLKICGAPNIFSSRTKQASSFPLTHLWCIPSFFLADLFRCA